MTLVYIALTQISIKSGLYKYKREGHAAVAKDFLQQHTQESFGPLRAEGITYEQKRTH